MATYDGGHPSHETYGCLARPEVQPTGSLRRRRERKGHDGSPHRIRKCELLLDKTKELVSAGHGIAPDLIYARGVPDFPSLDSTSFNKTQCTLILIEIGFCRDFGCDNKFEKNITRSVVHYFC